MSSIHDADLQILQIMPAAPGWVAAYEWAGTAYTLPLIGWALVERPDPEGPAPFRYVVGLLISGETGTVDLAEGEGFQECRQEGAVAGGAHEGSFTR